MKYLLKILLSLFLSVAISDAQDCKSSVSVSAENSETLIFIDNGYIGNGAVRIDLSEGKHTLKIKEPGINWDARTFEKEIVIEECGKDYKFYLKFTDNYLIKTDPADAAVYSSDSLLGWTPVLISKDIEIISVEKRDYNSKRFNITELKPVNNINLDFTGKLSAKSFAETPFFKILISTAVGFGAVAAYYKIQADQSFDKYEETKQQKYLDETNKYDNFSGVAFGALQLNFGALIYFLLSDQ